MRKTSLVVVIVLLVAVFVGGCAKKEEASGVSSKVSSSNAGQFSDEEILSLIKSALYTTNRDFRYSNVKLEILEKGQITADGRLPIKVKSDYIEQNHDAVLYKVFPDFHHVTIYFVSKDSFGKMMIVDEGGGLKMRYK